MICSGIDLWEIDKFRWVLLSLGLYQMLGHVSNAITTHRVVTKSKIIDHAIVL